MALPKQYLQKPHTSACKHQENSMQQQPHALKHFRSSSSNVAPLQLLASTTKSPPPPPGFHSKERPIAQGANMLVIRITAKLDIPIKDAALLASPSGCPAGSAFRYFFNLAVASSRSAEVRAISACSSSYLDSAFACFSSWSASFLSTSACSAF